MQTRTTRDVPTSQDSGLGTDFRKVFLTAHIFKLRAPCRPAVWIPIKSDRLAPRVLKILPGATRGTYIEGVNILGHWLLKHKRFDVSNTAIFMECKIVGGYLNTKENYWRMEETSGKGEGGRGKIVLRELQEGEKFVWNKIIIFGVPGRWDATPRWPIREFKGYRI